MKKFMVTIVVLLLIIALGIGGILATMITGVDVTVRTKTPKVSVDYVESEVTF